MTHNRMYSMNIINVNIINVNQYFYKSTAIVLTGYHNSQQVIGPSDKVYLSCDNMKKII